MYLLGQRLSEKKRQARVKNRRVHMSNERTFLAWMRTSIGIMAFGFVIEKFFVSSGQNKITGPHTLIDGLNCCAIMGICLLFLGAAAGFLATYRFLKTEEEIMEDTYHPSVVADVLLAILLGSIGLLLVIYLINVL
ncbi:MAG: DUF202 domain-containing protein [Nitrospiraceae bacterium]|nr:DUF202 domain-containing protein [Nitrospiraceae bacterium]